MIRRILLLTLLSAILVACGGAAAPGAGQPVQIQFFYPVQAPGPQSQLLDQYIAAFEQQHPEIDVQPVLAGNYNDTLTKIQTTIRGGGAPPAVAVLLATDLYTLRQDDALLPLDALVKEAGAAIALDDLYPAMLLNSRDQGQLWSLPFQRSVPVMYYNRDAFAAAGLDPDQPPATWDDLVTACSALTMRDSAGVIRWGLQIPSDGFPNWLFQAFALSAGQNLIADDPAAVTFNTPAAIESLDFWHALSATHQCMPPGVLSWANTPNDFTSGSVAMIYHTSGSLQNILQQAPFQVGVAPIPGKIAPAVPTGGGNLYLFKDASPAQQQAAWTFVQFLLQPERAADWAIQTGYIAVRPSAYQLPAMQQHLAKVPQAAVARDQLATAGKDLAVYNRPEVQQIFATAHTAVLTGAKPAPQALEEAQRAADQVLAPFR